MKRSKFNLSYTNLLSCDMGELVPIGVEEVLPGDTLQLGTEALVRFAPMQAPVMHPVNAVIHHWFVPFRIIWDDWENFITGGPDGNSTPAFPTITAPAVTGFPVGSLADYLGCPVGVASFGTSALPFRAYAKIWNEYYRDQDLQTALTIDTTDGADTTTNTALQYAPWEKDYYTTARLYTQKGPEVTIPILGDAPVYGTGKALGLTDGTNTLGMVSNTGPTFTGTSGNYNTNVGTANSGSGYVATNKAIGVVTSGVSGLEADLSASAGVPVNDVRLALALQRYEEARSRYGSRYTEYLQYLGVRSSDARLQRPEYLGGGKHPIQFSEVLQTAEGTDPVGELRGHGIGVARSNRFRKFFEEHGIVITLMAVKPKTIYMQGSPRMYNRRTKEDFWQRELQHIGQQEVLNKEIYAPSVTPDGTFGYQDRYDEYRRRESRVSGEFRTSLLNYWHLAREFNSAPTLNGSFVSAASVTDRIFSLQDGEDDYDHLYIMAQHRVTAKRLVAKTGKSFIY